MYKKHMKQKGKSLTLILDTYFLDGYFLLLINCNTVNGG